MFFRKRAKAIRAKELILEDDQGRRRADLRMDEDNNTVLRFADENGVCRMLLGLTAQGNPRIVLAHADGSGRLEIEANQEVQSTGVLLTGATGKVQAVFAVTGNGLPVVVLFDEQGKGLYPPEFKGMSLEDAAPSGGFDWDDILRKL